MWIDLHGVRRKLYVYFVLFLELDNISVFSFCNHCDSIALFLFLYSAECSTNILSNSLTSPRKT